LPSEKEVIKSNLLHFIKQNPIKEKREFFHWPAVFMSMANAPTVRYVSLVAMVLVVGGGSVAFAAQNSQPGEFLYSVKTGVSEKVLAFTLFSPKAKAEFQINLAQLRLEELETIAYQNKLDGKNSAKVQALLNNHVEDVKKRVSSLNGQDKSKISVEINSRLEASLNAHAKVLGELSGKDNNSSEGLKNILDDVTGKAAQSAASRQSGELTLVVEKSNGFAKASEGKLKAAQQAINVSASLVASKQENLSAQVFAKAQADLDVARQHIVEGQKEMVIGEYAKAFIFFQNALRQAQEVKIYISNESKLELHFNLQGSLLAPIRQQMEGGGQKNDIDVKIDIDNKLNIINKQ